MDNVKPLRKAEQIELEEIIRQCEADDTDFDSSSGRSGDPSSSTDEDGPLNESDRRIQVFEKKEFETEFRIKRTKASKIKSENVSKPNPISKPPRAFKTGKNQKDCSEFKQNTLDDHNLTKNEVKSHHKKDEIPPAPEAELESLSTIQPLFDLILPPDPETPIKDSNSEVEVDFNTDNSHSSRTSQISMSVFHSETPTGSDLDSSQGSLSPTNKSRNSNSSKIKGLLKSVRSQVRTQFSSTNLKLQEIKLKTKLKLKLKSKSSLLGDLHSRNSKNSRNDPTSFPRHPQRRMTQALALDIISDLKNNKERSSTPVHTFESYFERVSNNMDDNLDHDKIMKKSNEISNRTNIWLPNWLQEIPLSVTMDKSADQLNNQIDLEYERWQSMYPGGWERAIENSTKSSKDFRRICLFISGIVEFPRNVVTLAYNPRCQNILALGGEDGFLKRLELKDNTDTKLHHKKEGFFMGVSSHENIPGHLGHVQQLKWRKNGDNPFEDEGRLMTTDSKGVIMGWAPQTGENVTKYSVDLIQDRAGSTILGFEWSPLNTRVCFMYKDQKEGQSEYGIVLGLANGLREWSKKIGNIPSGIVWLDERKFALCQENGISVNHINNLVVQTRYFPNDNVDTDGKPGEKSKIISFLGKPDTAWKDTGVFKLAVVWQLNKMILFTSLDNPHQITIQTRLNTTAADWSPNGLFIAIGGSHIDHTLNKRRNRNPLKAQVNIFNCVGKLLTTVLLPNPETISSLSWDMDSYNIAIGSKKMLYIGTVRPVYKFATSGSGTTYAYAFTQDDHNYLAFWDKRSLNTQEVNGKVVDLTNHGERFTLLSINDKGIYCVSILSKTGHCLESLVILTMDPFQVCLTDSCLICLSPKSVLFWRYSSSTNGTDDLDALLTGRQTSREFGSNRKLSNSKRVRQIHIVEQPSLIPTVLYDPNQNEDYDKPTLDPAVCMDAKLDRLCIARHSGTIKLYCLPHGGVLQVIHIGKFNPFMLQFNETGTQLALLDMSGSLLLGSVEISEKTSYPKMVIEGTSRSEEVLNLLWSRDMPNYLCVMEKTRMYILKDGDQIEEFKQINNFSGYLASYQNMTITLLQLDDLLKNPELPSRSSIIELDMKILFYLRQTFLNYNQPDIDHYQEIVQIMNHPRLWDLWGELHLLQGSKFNIQEAQFGFIRSKNYPALMFIKKLECIPEEKEDLRRAEILAFLESYEEAAKHYIKAGRRDLAVDMFEKFGDFKSTQELSFKDRDDLDSEVNFRFKVVQQEAEISPKNDQNLAESLFNLGEIESGLKIFHKVKNYSRIFDSLVLLDDTERLKQLATEILNKPLENHVILKIAERFAFLGLTSESVELYLAKNLYEKAVEVALKNLKWNLALEIAKEHKIPMVQETLLELTSQLLKSGDIFQAVQFLKNCGKTFAAGKLLATIAIRQMGFKERPDFLCAKKLFVMAALILKEVKSVKLFKNSDALDDIDLKFDTSIPTLYRPNLEELRWMTHDPWRGAKAIQYLILVEKFLHLGQFRRATILGNHLRTFVDILGKERVNCIVALAAANGSYRVECLGALKVLEGVDEEYKDVGVDLMSMEASFFGGIGDKKDVGDKSSCCNSDLGLDTICPKCCKQVPICIISGVILQNSYWTCGTCGGMANFREIRDFGFCPLCHNSSTK